MLVRVLRGGRGTRQGFFPTSSTLVTPQPPQRQDPPMPPIPSPTYERLRHYIAKRMRMNHVYQPLMLMELLGRRRPAPAQDVARGPSSRKYTP